MAFELFNDNSDSLNWKLLTVFINRLFLHCSRPFKYNSFNQILHLNTTCIIHTFTSRSHFKSYYLCGFLNETLHLFFTASRMLHVQSLLSHMCSDPNNVNWGVYIKIVYSVTSPTACRFLLFKHKTFSTLLEVPSLVHSSRYLFLYTPIPLDVSALIVHPQAQYTIGCCKLIHQKWIRCSTCFMYY